jgi:hypothetical protein
VASEVPWVERVGRILFRQARAVPCPPFSQNWKDYETDAREIIEAMRVPSEAMNQAAWAMCGDNAPWDRSWAAMIDAALKEPTEP